MISARYFKRRAKRGGVIDSGTFSGASRGEVFDILMTVVLLTSSLRVEKGLEKRSARWLQSK